MGNPPALLNGKKTFTLKFKARSMPGLTAAPFGDSFAFIFTLPLTNGQADIAEQTFTGTDSSGSRYLPPLVHETMRRARSERRLRSMNRGPAGAPANVNPQRR